MSNIGKYVWGETKDDYYSSPFDTREECLENIKASALGLLCNDRNCVFMGRIVEEFDYRRAASDLAVNAENLACDFDMDATLSDAFIDEVAELLKSELDMRDYKVKPLHSIDLREICDEN
jgi:hypothetical protein